MIFFGLKMPARVSRRSSGTLTTPTLRVTPPYPPVSAWPRVRVLKTVVLPDPASPTMAICIRGLSPGSVPRAGVDHVEQRLARREAPEVVAEQVDAPVEDARARPRRVRGYDDVRHVVERRRFRQRLIAERVEDGASEMAILERPDQGALIDEPPARDVDQPGARLDHRQRVRVDHPLGLGRERRSVHDELGLCQPLRECLATAPSVEHAFAERPRLVVRAERRPFGVSSPTDRDDTATEGGRESTHRAADGPEPDDADGDVAQLGTLERLPRALALQLEQLREPPADGEDHHQDVFGDRPAEHAARIRDDDAALPGRWGERSLDARGRRVDPRQPRSTNKDAIEGLRAEPAAKHHLDFVERPVGQTLHRDGDDPRARRRRPDALQVPRPVACREDGAQRDGSRCAARAGPGPCVISAAGSHVALAALSVASRTRTIQRSAASISPSRGKVSGPVQSAVRAAGPRASAIARTNRSPFLYCSILRSIPVSRSIVRSNGVRLFRRSWNRSLIRSTPGTRSRPTSSMT